MNEIFHYSIIFFIIWDKSESDIFAVVLQDEAMRSISNMTYLSIDLSVKLCIKYMSLSRHNTDTLG